jgi:hypothetical protein
MNASDRRSMSGHFSSHHSRKEKTTGMVIRCLAWCIPWFGMVHLKVLACSRNSETYSDESADEFQINERTIACTLNNSFFVSAIKQMPAIVVTLNSYK